MVVNAVMVKKERDEHRLIYYVSKVFQGKETKYSTIEKFVNAVVIATKKMKSYFQAP